MNRGENSDWLASDLCAALHALSADGTYALAMQEPDARRPEELALMFGNAVLKAIEDPDLELTAPLLRTLNDLATLLNDMSAQRSGLWTEDAVRNDPSWRRVQSLAKKALTELGVDREGVRLN